MAADFAGRVVWITGASSGIGAALARLFADAGTRLALSARRADLLEAVARDCGAGRARAWPLDVADRDAVDLAAAAIEADLGPVDILVANAGLSQRSLVRDTEFETYRTLMDVNFFGALAPTLAVLPAMRARGSGHMVFLSSPVGRFGTPLRSGYAAAKHAVEGFAESLRAEVAGEGIGVTLALPGPIATEISKAAVTGDGTPYGEADAFLAQGIPAADCARRIFEAVAAGQDEVFIVDEAVRADLALKRDDPAAFRAKMAGKKGPEA